MTGYPNPAGNRTRTTWPKATPFYVTTTCDALNRPTVIKELGSTSLATYLYDDLSRRTMITLGNGTTTTYGYSSTQGTLASLTHNLTGSAQDITTTYTRNQVREILSHSWTNDLYQWSGAVNGSKAYTTNELNQYTTVGANALGYDGNGNLAGDGYWAYGYDLDNRLKSATAPGYSATLAYDGEGRLRQNFDLATNCAKVLLWCHFRQREFNHVHHFTETFRRTQAAGRCRCRAERGVAPCVHGPSDRAGSHRSRKTGQFRR